MTKQELLEFATLFQRSLEERAALEQRCAELRAELECARKELADQRHIYWNFGAKNS